MRLSYESNYFSILCTRPSMLDIMHALYNVTVRHRLVFDFEHLFHLYLYRNIQMACFTIVL